MIRVLVIDDEQPLREVIADTLELAGYQVFAAEDGARGLDLLGCTAVDLVVTDIMLPKVDGLQVIATLRRHGNGVPVLAISGGSNLSQFDPLRAARQAGADATLAKPFAAAQLLATVAACLGKTATGPATRR